MPQTLVEELAFALPKEDRRSLGQRLLDSTATDEELLSEFSPEQWAEIDRRLAEYESGKATTYSHEEVIRGAEELLKDR